MLDVCCWRRVQPINATRLAAHERGRRRKGEMVYFDGLLSKDKIANKIVDGDFGVAAGRAASPRPTDGSHLAAVAAAAEERVATVRFEPGHADARRHVDLLKDLA